MRDQLFLGLDKWTECVPQQLFRNRIDTNVGMMFESIAKSGKMESKHAYALCVLKPNV